MNTLTAQARELSKLRHPSNSKNFSQGELIFPPNEEPFPMREYLLEELPKEYADDELIDPEISKLQDIMSGPMYYKDKLLWLMNARVTNRISHEVYTDARHRLWVGFTPELTGNMDKLPSQSVNYATETSSTDSGADGILEVGKVRALPLAILKNLRNKLWGLNNERELK